MLGKCHITTFFKVQQYIYLFLTINISTPLFLLLLQCCARLLVRRHGRETGPIIYVLRRIWTKSSCFVSLLWIYLLCCSRPRQSHKVRATTVSAPPSALYGRCRTAQIRTSPCHYYGVVRWFMDAFSSKFINHIFYKYIACKDQK